MRTPILLFLLALAARLVAIAVFPDPAYPDSTYYVEVARSIASGHGLTVDFVWILAEVGNRIPDVPTLPVPSNAHWLPLASLIQVPGILLLGPTAFASALPLALVGSIAAPLTWAIARDMGTTPAVARAAGVLSAIPGVAMMHLSQPENFAILHPLVAATLWCVARGLRGDGRAFAFAGLLAGLASLARNDGVLLGGAVGLVWLGDRIRWWRARRGSGGWARVDDRRPISFLAAVGCFALFLLVMGPWWARQLAVFGSISPTSSNGAALWIVDIREWNSITVEPTLDRFLAQGPAAILASRLSGLGGALAQFAVFITSIVLLPFLILGIAGRWRDRAVVPWLVYTVVVFAGAALIYPLHVPGGAFIHSAIGLAPYAVILSLEGVANLTGAIAARRRVWDTRRATSVLLWGVTAIVVATAPYYATTVVPVWEEPRAQRLALAAAIDGLGVAPDDRILSIDAGAIHHWTGRPGVVTPDDPMPTIQAVAEAYGTRWLVLERDDLARALAPVLKGESRPDWIGPAVFSLPSDDGGPPELAVYPVCTGDGDARCAAP